MKINSINQSQSFKGVFVNVSGDYEKLESDSFVQFHPLSVNDLVDNAKNQVTLELTSDSAGMKNKTGDKFFTQVNIEKMPVILTDNDAVKFNSLKHIREQKNFIAETLKSKFKFKNVQDLTLDILKRIGKN